MLGQERGRCTVPQIRKKNYIIFAIHVSTISENAAYMCMSRTKACWLLVTGVEGVGGWHGVIGGLKERV